jgi:hypothetical protein
MLFDMERDPQQFNNLVAHPEYAGQVQALHERLMERIQGAGKKN